MNHRVAALLTSHFDVLFVVNELPRPGEKRLISHALVQCQKTPRDMSDKKKDLLESYPKIERVKVIWSVRRTTSARSVLVILILEVIPG